MMPDIDITQLVPRFLLCDKNGYALAKAIETLMQRVTIIVQTGLNEVLDIAKMSEWRLDEMAWEWHVTWYDYDADIDTKRRTIQGMHEVFSTAGTPSAIQAALQQYFGDGAVEEWDAYGGEPYRFRVTTVNPKATGEQARQLAAMVELLKNTRSVYDGAVIERWAELQMRAGQHVVIGKVLEFWEKG